MTKQKKTPEQSAPLSGHERHCFVVMPFGRTPEEVEWFTGWGKEVIFPAIRDAQYEPILAATEDRPNAINDEIRAHLAFDPMVVVDLGGPTADFPPNPNVMYELGIRHALNLAVVMMAWKDQRLPFDISNQRVIMEKRGFIDVEVNRTRLRAFIAAAASGDYYRPMEAVGRVASLAISASLSDNDVLGALIDEVRALREKVQPSSTAEPREKVTLRDLVGSKKRQLLYRAFLNEGGVAKEWGVLLDTRLAADLRPQAAAWDTTEWLPYLLAQREELRKAFRSSSPSTTTVVSGPTSLSNSKSSESSSTE